MLSAGYCARQAHDVDFVFGKKSGPADAHDAALRAVERCDV